MDWTTAPDFVLLGHRGVKRLPENTLPSLAMAVEDGASGFEFDVQISSDGVPVVIHDLTVNRTTNGTGRVTHQPISALRELDAGDGNPIPTLEEVFATFGSKILYNLEIKDDHWRNQGTEQAVMDQISAFGLEKHVLISSFNPLCLARARKIAPADIKFGFLRYLPHPRQMPYLVTTEADHPHHRMVDEAYMQWAKSAGMQVNVWTVDEIEAAVRLHALGVNCIISNVPGQLLPHLF